MSNNGPRDINGLAGALTTTFSTVVGWQSQVEFWLRIASLVVGIVAGLYTIRYYIRKSN